MFISRFISLSSLVPLGHKAPYYKTKCCSQSNGEVVPESATGLGNSLLPAEVPG